MKCLPVPILPKGLVEYPGFESIFESSSSTTTVRCCDRPFHRLAAATENLLSPKLVLVLLMKTILFVDRVRLGQLSWFTNCWR
jgi:hypothetical protein